MKLDTALEEMEVVLNELNEQFETIKKNEVRVPQIEIDIIMATMRRLYESMGHLNKQKSLENTKKPVENKPEVTEHKEEIETTTAVVEEVATEEVEAKAEESIEETVAVEEATNYEEVTDDFQEEINALEESAINEFEEAKDEETKTEKPKPSLLLQFEDEIFSVNESVAQKGEDRSLVSKLSNTRIENLKSAIGINDKFYFINELFSGNSQAYEDVIYTLNNFKKLDEAIQYTSTLEHRYEWSTETEAYQKLIHFLERKFVEIHA